MTDFTDFEYVPELLAEVADERRRNIARFGVQTHADGDVGTQRDVFREAQAKIAYAGAVRRDGRPNWRVILDEEVKEAYAATDDQHRYEELIQVAAMALAWAEAIKRRNTK